MYELPPSMQPPNRGQVIRAPFLRQEYRYARRGRQPDAVGPELRRFRVPSGGIPAMTVDGDKDVPGSAECVPMRWVGDGWVDDEEALARPVYNSYPGESVPAGARVWAAWSWNDHWEAMMWSCEEEGA